MSWAPQFIGQIRYLRVRSGHPWSWLVYRVVLSLFATTPLVVAGIILLQGRCDALYWLVLGFVFSFIAAIMSAWVLLIEILR